MKNLEVDESNRIYVKICNENFCTRAYNFRALGDFFFFYNELNQ